MVWPKSAFRIGFGEPRTNTGANKTAASSVVGGFEKESEKVCVWVGVCGNRRQEAIAECDEWENGWRRLDEKRRENDKSVDSGYSANLHGSIGGE